MLEEKNVKRSNQYHVSVFMFNFTLSFYTRKILSSTQQI